MFTGIVQCTGRVESMRSNAFGARLVVDPGDGVVPGGFMPGVGDSISVSGVCLTVAGTEGTALVFDVVAETLGKTTLGDLTGGSRVNLEPPVTVDQALGGHFVQGHVDGVGRVHEVRAGDAEWRITAEPPPGLMGCIVPTGSIAVDGVSLTIAGVDEATFTVALIPTTLDRTTLGQLHRGARVNLEADIISKTVVHQLGRQAGPDTGVTMRTLREAGFV